MSNERAELVTEKERLEAEFIQMENAEILAIRDDNQVHPDVPKRKDEIKARLEEVNRRLNEIRGT